MQKREQTMYNILTAAMELFRQNGFQNTSVRQIAEKADVALGMINHYFVNKEYLGTQVLSLLDTYSGKQLAEKISFHEDPVLYDLCATRIYIQYLFEHGYKELYLDSLRKDFFFHHVLNRPMRLVEALQKIYHFEASEDDCLLYTRYLAYMMEKTVMLKKEEGMFETISYEEVPYLICETSMGHFIPEEEIKKRNLRSKEVAAEICSSLEDFPPEDMVLEFIRHLDSSMRQASADSREYWLKQLSSMNQ